MRHRRRSGARSAPGRGRRSSAPRPATSTRGAFDPLDEIADAVAGTGAWLHVDGAFGLWAAASPRFRHSSRASERADSWATDAHKWLNVPYDCGHRLLRPSGGAPRRDVRRGELPEQADSGRGRATRSTGSPSSRAAPAGSRSTRRSSRSAGKAIAALVERCCDHARRFARAARRRARGRDPERRRPQPGARPLRRRRRGDARAVRRVQEDGTCWLRGRTGRAGPRCGSRSRTGGRQGGRRASTAAILAAAAAAAAKLASLPVPLRPPIASAGVTSGRRRSSGPAWGSSSPGRVWFVVNASGGPVWGVRAGAGGRRALSGDTSGVPAGGRQPLRDSGRVSRWGCTTGRPTRRTSSCSRARRC